MFRSMNENNKSINDLYFKFLCVVLSVDLMKEKCTLTANVNVVSISIGKLVTIKQGQRTQRHANLCTQVDTSVSHLLFSSFKKPQTRKVLRAQWLVRNVAPHCHN